MDEDVYAFRASTLTRLSGAAVEKAGAGGNGEGYVAEVRCSWDKPTETHGTYSLTILDVHTVVRQGKEDANAIYFQSSALSELLEASLVPATFGPGASWTGRVLVALPARPGFLPRNETFQERFVGCADLGVLLDRSEFGRSVRPPRTGELQDLLDESLFMIVREQDSRGYLIDEASLFDEVRARVNFEWLLTEEPKQKTLALVDGHLNLASYLGLYHSARALGAKIVLLDRIDHWITAPQYRHLYDDYIAIDMTQDDNFHLRIVDAVKEYGHVDGICGIATYSLPPVARAAAILGLPTEPPEAVACANDKHQTRLFDKDPVQMALIDDVADLKTQMAQMPSPIPEYPVVAKPVFGTGSAHVHKVDDEASLLEVVGRIADGTGRKVLIEEYVEGPELDINFVLLDGELLFFEMNDDFPSPGDDGATDGDFWETINAFPTILPPTEYALLRDRLHTLLLDMGLRTGVFHLEAKVQNSAMEYRSQDGFHDLRTKLPGTGDADQVPPRCFLIEVNPRPPGMACCFATGGTYGVNLYDLHVLRMLGDLDRFRALAKPFDEHAAIPYNARIWSELYWLRADKGGICDTDEDCSELLEALSPAGRRLVTRSVCFFRRGQRIPDPVEGVVRLGGFIFLTSRNSREDLLRLSSFLDEHVSIPVVSAN